MANELTILLQVAAQTGVLNYNFASGQLQYDMAEDRMVSNVIDVGTSEEALSAGDMSSEGYLLLKNADATNYIEVGLTASYTARLYPGDIAVFPPVPGATIYAKADTATAKLFYAWFNGDT